MIGELTLTDLARQILNRIQMNFPLTADPYGRLASDLGTSRAEVHETVCALRQDGVIRRIGASYVPGRLGYCTTLVAVQVNPIDIDRVAACASAFPEVTHNYERDHRLNLWFTVIAPSQSRLQSIVTSVGAAPGVQTVHALPALQTFKLKVEFCLGGTGGSGIRMQESGAATMPPGTTSAPPSIHKHLVALTCGDIDTSPDPYSHLAAATGLSRREILARLLAYQDQGILRRFGAILRHRTVGFVGNGMTVWRVPVSRMEEVGNRLSACRDISHCYHRQPVPGWPYNLYAMVHRQDHAGVRNLCHALAEEVEIDEYCILFSTREFKKTSMVYFADQI